MLNALVIVWRESLEGMLVIGVLLSWIVRQSDPRLLKRGLWLGTFAGLLLAVAMGVATFAVQSTLDDETLERFQLFMLLVAAGLILHTVLWMHRHGRHMKRELEGQASKRAGALGIGLIAMLALAREGTETVVFLYGLGMENAGGSRVALLSAALMGLLLAGATSWLVARGARFLNYRTLFRVSEILLLLVANALLANDVERMVALEWLPPLLDPAWDTSAILADGQSIGRFLADFAGYRARPSGILLAASLAFWGYALWRFRNPQAFKAADAQS